MGAEHFLYAGGESVIHYSGSTYGWDRGPVEETTLQVFRLMARLVAWPMATARSPQQRGSPDWNEDVPCNNR